MQHANNKDSQNVFLLTNFLTATLLHDSAMSILVVSNTLLLQCLHTENYSCNPSSPQNELFHKPPDQSISHKTGGTQLTDSPEQWSVAEAAEAGPAASPWERHYLLSVSKDAWQRRPDLLGGGREGEKYQTYTNQFQVRCAVYIHTEKSTNISTDPPFVLTLKSCQQILFTAHIFRPILAKGNILLVSSSFFLF